MSESLSLLAALALLPAMTGPVSGGSAGNASIALALCNGGQLNIPIERVPAAPGTAPCCAKGCHSKRRKGTGGEEPLSE
ncbi:hypothetical protein FHS61_002814 [Altererythrobacter atlanticus]|uniref:Uncharacterized protein n=1 Tax=Croceibacterium atlanticum TaxID=1267766 RepID=A0A0F7KY85_9SPHN|nr:hypothetical protein [Croceibacterium atlanticum]AKH43780.1 hypothetical protein WYH_02750 [Croceibacterium atlanticum]MBB5733771.1 hypothetical protein [Croceibacterium atlanticum]